MGMRSGLVTAHFELIQNLNLECRKLLKPKNAETSKKTTNSLTRNHREGFLC